MIIACSSAGGIGNVIVGVVNLYLLSVLMGKQFKIVKNHNFPKTAFIINPEYIYSDNVNKTDIINAIDKSGLQLGKKIGLCSNLKSFWNVDEKIFIKCNVFICKVLFKEMVQTENVEKHMNNAFHFIFENVLFFAPAIEKLALTKKADIFLQVRMGDGFIGVGPRNFLNRKRLTKIISDFKTICAEYGEQFTSIYVTSDSKLVLQEIVHQMKDSKYRIMYDKNAFNFHTDRSQTCEVNLHAVISDLCAAKYCTSILCVSGYSTLGVTMSYLTTIKSNIYMFDEIHSWGKCDGNKLKYVIV